MQHPPALPPADELRPLLLRATDRRLSEAACQRLRWFLYYAERQHSVSATCRHFGISRSSFYRWIRRFDPHDLSSLEERPHDPHTPRDSGVPAGVVELIRRYRTRYPQMGKERLQHLLRQEHGVTVSVSTVGRVIERECLYFADTPLHWKKRERQPVAAAPQPAPTVSGADGLRSGEGSAEPRVPATETGRADMEEHVPYPRGRASGREPCPCHLCEFRRCGSAWMKRAVLVASLIVNIALIGLMLATAAWEKSRADERHAAAGEAQTSQMSISPDSR